MSFSWATLLASAKTALSTIAVDAGPILQAGEAVLPVVDLIPGAAPVVTAIEAGAAGITAIAPTAVADATTAFGAIEKIITDGSPLLTEFETLWGSVFHATPAPGGAVLLTPVTSAATAPAASVTSASAPLAALAAAPGAAKP